MESNRFCTLIKQIIIPKSTLYTDKSLQAARYLDNTIEMNLHTPYKQTIEELDSVIKHLDSLHVYFHYQGAALYHNRWVVLKQKSDFKHTEFLYHDIYKNGVLEGLLDPRKHLLGVEEYAGWEGAELVVYKNSRYNTLHDEFCKTNDIEILTKMIEASNGQHFNYHIDMANLYLLRTLMEYLCDKNMGLCMAYLNKALYFENKNPINGEIVKLINILSEEI